jgi:hypothetical protein
MSPTGEFTSQPSPRKPTNTPASPPTQTEDMWGTNYGSLYPCTCPRCTNRHEPEDGLSNFSATLDNTARRPQSQGSPSKRKSKAAPPASPAIYFGKYRNIAGEVAEPTQVAFSNALVEQLASSLASIDEDFDIFGSYLASNYTEEAAITIHAIISDSSLSLPIKVDRLLQSGTPMEEISFLLTLNAYASLF